MLTDTAFGLRRPTDADVEAITDLINASDEHDYGAHDLTVDDVREEMGASDLDRDAWVVERDGRLVGIGALQVRAGVRFAGTIYVHPEQRRRGVGSDLLRLLESRGAELVAEAPAEAEVTMVGWVNAESAPMVEWATRRGYEPVRQFLRMQIQFDAAPPAPSWPEGISVRTYDPERDARPLFEAVEEAFADHWGHLPMDYDDWIGRTERQDFDPTLWFVATDGGEIAAMSLAALMIPDGGWIRSVGVRRPWRQRGIARALLLHTFGELWRRDRRWAALGVDAESLTGATRLYESVGMSVRERHAQISKVLRPGESLAVEALG